MRRWRPWPYISIMPCSRRLAWHESISQIFVFFLLEFSIKILSLHFYYTVFCMLLCKPFAHFLHYLQFFYILLRPRAGKMQNRPVRPSLYPIPRAWFSGSDRSRSRKSGPCFPIGLLRPGAAAYIFPEPKTAPRRSCLRRRLPVAAETILTNPRGLCYI